MVEAEAENGHVTVRVQRPRAGILPEHHDHIFEKFGRACRSAKPGTGLGLFLRARSPRRTAAPSRWNRARARARRSRSPSRLPERRLPRQLDAAEAKLAEQLRCSLRDRRPDVVGLQHDCLAAVGENLADQPIARADAEGRERRAVRQPDRAALDSIAATDLA